MNFVLSTAALIAGPFLYALGLRNARAHKALDVLIVAAIAWIVGAHIIPEALEMAGYMALALLLLGMAFPYLIGHIFHLASSTAHVALLALAAVALVLHAVIDGIALLPGSGDGLAIAVILHRIPVGMAIWWTFRPGIGDIAAIGAFVLVIAATAATYFFGTTFIEMAESQLLALFQAFVAGALVNLVFVKLRELW
jgi:hypothetical protein